MRSVIKFSTILILPISVSIGLLACAPANPGITPLPQTEIPVAPEPPMETYPQVLRGWLEAYSSHIQAKVSGDFPELLGISDARMSTVCAQWHGLTRGERENFWSALLYSIAGAESGRARTAIYRETTLSIDSVTGQQIRSEGLLQLSYVDVVSYHYLEDDVSWEKDRAMALSDYSSGTSSGNPDRSILNAYANLNLGLFIMNRLIAIHPTESLETAFGRYWSTMRVSGTSFTSVLASLKAKMPGCF